MAVYGIDLVGVDDLDPSLEVVDGPVAVAYAVARRLLTPPGGLFYDLDYGYDLRRLLNAPMRSASEVSYRVRTEALKDERVLEATASVVRAGAALLVRLNLLTDDGPFAFSIRIDQLSVELLRQGA